VSTQLDFFTEKRFALVEQYANLVAPAFAAEEFYRLKEIALAPMPPPAVQQHSIANFRQRVLALKKQDSHLSEPEAELRVIQDLEAAFLQEMECGTSASSFERLP
jgi:hypothetical protein